MTTDFFMGIGVAIQVGLLGLFVYYFRQWEKAEDGKQRAIEKFIAEIEDSITECRKLQKMCKELNY